MEIGHGQWVAEYNDNGVDANRAQAQVAIKKGTELTIRYTHMLQVQNTHNMLQVQIRTCYRYKYAQYTTGTNV